jgi:translation initiation factor 5A
MKKVVEVSKIKKGGYIIYEDESYKVLDVVHSKAGKHGHGKYRMQIMSVIGGKKKSIVMGSGNKIDVPIIEKHNAQILTIEDKVEQVGTEKIEKKIANVMDSESYETLNIEIPEEFWDDVKEGSKIVYWDVIGIPIMKQVTN